MYLFMFKDGTIKQVVDNLSISDIIAVKEGLLTVIRFKQFFWKLEVEDEQLLWRHVGEAKLLCSSNGGFHQ